MTSLPSTTPPLPVSACFRVTIHLLNTATGSRESYVVYPKGLGYKDSEGYLCGQNEQRIEGWGTVRYGARAADQGDDPQDIIFVLSFANDDTRLPPGRLGLLLDVEVGTARGVIAMPLAATPEGWTMAYGDPLELRRTTWRWNAYTGAGNVLPAWREVPLHLLVHRGNFDTLHARTLQILTEGKHKPFDVPPVGQCIARREWRTRDWLSTWNPSLWNNQGLNVQPNIGASGLSDNMGHYPVGQAEIPLYHLAIAASKITGQRPLAVPLAGVRNAYCFGQGLHWTSSYMAGFETRPDRSWTPPIGDNGWDGPDQEHAEDLILDLAYQTRNPWHINRAIRTARTFLAAHPIDPEHVGYFGSSFFSMRGLQRVMSCGVKASYLSREFFLTEMLPWVRAWLPRIDRGFRVSLKAPAHAPRRPDEVVRGEEPIIDTWQIGTKFPTLWAFGNFLREQSEENLSDNLREHLFSWWRFAMDSIVESDKPPHFGKRLKAMYKQSLAADPSVGREPLTPGYDDAIMLWSAAMASIPMPKALGLPESEQDRRRLVAAAGFLETCNISFPATHHERVKWDFSPSFWDEKLQNWTPKALWT